MNKFISELTTNSSYTWHPRDIAERTNMYGNNRWVAGDEFKELPEGRSSPWIVMYKEVGSTITALEAAQILKTMNIANFILKTTMDYDRDYARDRVKAVCLSPHDYQNFIAGKVLNKLEPKGDTELDLETYQKLMKYHEIIPLSHPAIQQICENSAAVQLQRELTWREKRGFSYPAEVGWRYFECFANPQQHPIFCEDAGGVWQPAYLNLEGTGDIYLVKSTGEEIEAASLGKPCMAKTLTRETAPKIFEGLKALGIPYVVLRDQGYELSSYWWTNLKVFIRPEDFAKIENMLSIAFDPKKEQKALTPELLKRVFDRFPSNQEGIVDSKTWLKSYWRALAVELNRPLTSQEEERPVKSFPGDALSRLREEMNHIDNSLKGLEGQSEELLKGFANELKQKRAGLQAEFKRLGGDL